MLPAQDNNHRLPLMWQVYESFSKIERKAKERSIIPSNQKSTYMIKASLTVGGTCKRSNLPNNFLSFKC